MSTIQRLPDNVTELRLDYQDISAGPLVIVIEGLPDERVPAARADRELEPVSPATTLVEEAQAIYEATSYAPILGTSLVLAAWRGQEVRASELIAVTLEDASADDECRASALAEYARAVLCNGLARYREALAAAECACAHEPVAPFPWALLELVEAAVRSDARDIAAEGVDRLAAWARTSGDDWAAGVHARSAALLSAGTRAERLYEEAVELLGRGHTAAHLARARLLYGEWLRRENRRVDARVQLRAAHEAFSRISAEGFAERARRELLATGETARKRTDEARAHLTPQEAQIARLAQEGLTNPEIGAQLFISPRTVQYHLRKVFQKLAISSRHQLGRIPPGRLDIAA